MQRYQEIICDKQYQDMIEKIKEYEKDREFCCHTLEHFCDVARIMYILALEEGSSLDQDIIYTTALLHDIGRVWEYEKGIPHEQASVEIAKEFLSKYGYEDDEIRIITTAIGAHRKEEVTVQVDLHTPLCRPYERIKQEGNGAIYMRSLPHSVTEQPSAELLQEEKEKNELANYLYRADKLSRNCFVCKAKNGCKWSEEKKNATLIL